MSYREFYHEEDGKLLHSMQDAHEAYTRGLKAEQINHPSHYTRGPIECIEAQRSALSPAEYKGYLKGCVMAYLWREMHKGGIDDVKKAQWFLDRLAETYGNGIGSGLHSTGDTLNPKTT